MDRVDSVQQIDAHNLKLIHAQTCPPLDLQLPHSELHQPHKIPLGAATRNQEPSQIRVSEVQSVSNMATAESGRIMIILYCT